MTTAKVSWPALAGSREGNLEVSELRWLPGAAGWSGSTPLYGVDTWTRLLPVARWAQAAPAQSLAAWLGGSPSLAVSVDVAENGSGASTRVFAWDRGLDLPAALGALFLPDLFLTRRPFWQDAAGPAEAPLVRAIELGEIVRRTAAARSALLRLVDEASLAAAYAAVLAGRRAIPLQARAALPAEALGAFLLPLPLEVANRITIAGWYPGTFAAELVAWAEEWQVIATDQPEVLAMPALERRFRERGRRLAAALVHGEPLANSDVDGVGVALWGPSAAGKTALLAQLHLKTDQGSAGDFLANWDSYPGDFATGIFFDQMRQRLTLENRFPAATSEADRQPLRYTFVERATGWKATLHLEDRAGIHSEKLETEMRQRLAAADGLVLLFDPLRPAGRLRTELLRTLEALQLGRGEPDSRPIAFCLSKADALIHTAADWRLAREAPQDFVERYLELHESQVLPSLKQYCANLRCFPIAAAEMDVVEGVPESRIFFDEAMEPRLVPGGTCLHLRSPFVWIFEELRRVS